MGEVTPLRIHQSVVDAAWNRYVVLAKDSVADQSLLLDRPFHQRLLRAHREFRETFEAFEKQQEAA
jgi:hypothetical protein